jgi:hypothetical protein
MGRTYHDKPILGPAEIIVIGDEVDLTADIDPGGTGRQARHDYPERRIHHDESVMMTAEEASIMEKETVSPMGYLPKSVGKLPDDGAVMSPPVAAPMILKTFTAMTASPAMDLPFAVPATAMAAASATAAMCHGAS